VAKRAKTSVWIGMNHVSSADTGEVTFQWEANLDVTYTNWWQGEPNGQVKVGFSANSCVNFTCSRLIGYKSLAPYP